jgi:uncharacterized Ntn-hydrolase superfamily protein
MSLILLTRDNNHIGGIYLGYNPTEETLYLGEGYFAGICGVRTEGNSQRVVNHFEQNGNLNGVHSGDKYAHYRQYCFITENNIVLEHSGMNRTETFMLTGQNSSVFGNTLVDDFQMFQNMLLFLDQSNLSVKDKLIQVLKDNKRDGIDVRAVGRSCKDLRILVGDYSGNIVFEQTIFDSTGEPIDLI